MNILYIDIETAPNLGLVFELWNQNISLAQLRESGDILCFAAFWDHAPNRPIFRSVWTEPREEVVDTLRQLLDKADVVVHYNGRKFDVPWIQRLFLEARIPPPSPFRQVDLYKVVKPTFYFPSYKLAYVAERLLGITKLKTDFELWVDVIARVPSACNKMRRYCIRDTKLLIPLYHMLMPWIVRAPNAALYAGDDLLCIIPGCGGELRKEGVVHTTTRSYQRYCCKKCGKWCRGTKSIGGVEVIDTPYN